MKIRMTKPDTKPAATRTRICQRVQSVVNTLWYPEGFAIETQSNAEPFPETSSPEDWPTWT